jgi:uroporphyrinogen III methyltransferase / synthase
MTSSLNKLSGKTVLVTRSQDQSTEFRALLESRGATVIWFPTIEIANPDSWDDCDRVIWKLAEYQAVCFTSKNSVTKFIERIRTLRPQAVDTLATRNIFAVGEKTKRALESSGFQVVASPSHSSAQELAKILQSHQIHGAKILFPKSQIARDELPEQLRAMGAEVDEVVVYKTIIPESKNSNHVHELMQKNKIDIITFFSPSSAINFVEMFGYEFPSVVVAVCIGPTTAETLIQLGLIKIVVAKQATIEGVVEAIEEYFNQNG